MERPEIDNRIKRALLCKTNEILPSEETFIQILAGLEKSQTRKTLNICFKHYVIAFMCAVSVIFGTTLIVTVDVRASAIQIINTVKTVLILNKNEKVFERNADEVFTKHSVSDNTQPGKTDSVKKTSMDPQLLHTGTNRFLLNQVHYLELCLRILLIGRMTLTLGQTWYNNKFRHRQVPSY